MTMPPTQTRRQMHTVAAVVVRQDGPAGSSSPARGRSGRTATERRRSLFRRIQVLADRRCSRVWAATRARVRSRRCKVTSFTIAMTPCSSTPDASRRFAAAETARPGDTCTLGNGPRDQPRVVRTIRPALGARGMLTPCRQRAVSRPAIEPPRRPPRPRSPPGRRGSRRRPRGGRRRGRTGAAHPSGCSSSAMSASEIASRCFTRARSELPWATTSTASPARSWGRWRRTSRAAPGRRRPSGTRWPGARRGRAAR